MSRPCRLLPTFLTASALMVACRRYSRPGLELLLSSLPFLATRMTTTARPPLSARLHVAESELEPASILVFGREFVLAWIDPQRFERIEPPVPLRVRETCPAPGTEQDDDGGATAVVDEQPVLDEPLIEPDELVRTVGRIPMLITRPRHLASHRLAAVLAQGHLFI
ncbi:hypothetical protein AB0M50_32820 [Nonomuraea fuscirosea]|jgi:hypothetical protein